MKSIQYSVKTIQQKISIVKEKDYKKIWFLYVPYLKPTTNVKITLNVSLSEPLRKSDVVMLNNGDNYIVIDSDLNGNAQLVNVFSDENSVNINMKGTLSVIYSCFSEGSPTPNN